MNFRISIRRYMRPVPVAILGGALQLLAVTSAQATQFVNASFEIGSMVGWETAGDVSIQTDDFGIAPTSGGKQVLITASRDAYSETHQLFGNFFETVGYPRFTWSDGVHQNTTPAGEASYSFIRQNLHVGPDELISFDYNFLTQEGEGGIDFATFFVQSLDQPNPYSYLFGGTSVIEPFTGVNTYQSFDLLTPARCYGFGPSDLCSYGPSYDEMPTYDSAVNLCNANSFCPFSTHETGWNTHTWRAAVEGDYAFYIAVIQQVDTLLGSALLVDNFKVRPVPEPVGAAGMLVVALAIGFAVRRDNAARSNVVSMRKDSIRAKK